LTVQDTTQDDDEIRELLEFHKTPKSRNEIQDFIGVKEKRDFSRRVLTPLVNKGLLHRTIPDKPTSPNQKYYSGPRV